MAATRTSVLLGAIALVLVHWLGLPVLADPLSIYDIQYTVDPSGASPYDGETVDCLGGIVTFTSVKTTPRVYLQHPDYPDGWGAIAIKDWTNSLVHGVSVGDWITLSGVEVEDHRGNTFLQYGIGGINSDFEVLSSGNPVPAPKAVSPAEIPAPVETTPDHWVVGNHDAEKYESMFLTIADVTVTAMDLGKAPDNYNLQNSAGDDVWAADYLNDDAFSDYHSSVQLGQPFDSVTGILEQYAKAGTSYEWDYYQLLTTCSEDLVVPEPSAVAMLAAGIVALGLGLARRRKTNQPLG